MQYCPGAKFINDGDDSVIVLERQDLEKLNNIPEYFSNLGFKMEIEPFVDTIEKVVFCQAQPVKVGPSYRFVR